MLGQVTALEKQVMKEQMQQQEQLLQQQAREMELAQREAEVKLQVAMAAQDAAHGKDLNLLEGGLFQRIQVGFDFISFDTLSECRGTRLSTTRDLLG